MCYPFSFLSTFLRRRLHRHVLLGRVGAFGLWDSLLVAPPARQAPRPVRGFRRSGSTLCQLPLGHDVLLDVQFQWKWSRWVLWNSAIDLFLPAEIRVLIHERVDRPDVPLSPHLDGVVGLLVDDERSSPVSRSLSNTTL